jgi:hypothetical protein
MRPSEAISSPVFPTLDPVILDADMDGLYQDGDMDFLNGHHFQGSTNDTGRDLDELFPQSLGSRNLNDDGACASPSELSIKQHLQNTKSLKRHPVLSADSPSDSPEDDSSPGSSSESVRDHARNSSVGSAVHSDRAAKFQSDTWLNPDMLGDMDDTFFGLDTAVGGFDRDFPMDTDIESSNKVMDSAFDFESAASSPSPLKTDAASYVHSHPSLKKEIRSPQNTANGVSPPKVSDPVR